MTRIPDAPAVPVALPEWRPAFRSGREVILSLATALAIAALFIATTRDRSLPALLLCSLALGFLAVQAVLIFHDCMHESLFPAPWPHRWLARAIGAFYLVPFHFLRASHLTHHRFAGCLTNDPEVLHASEAEAVRRPGGRVLARLARTPLAPLAFAPLLQGLHFLRWLGDRMPGVARAGLWQSVLIDGLAMAALWLPLGWWLAHGGHAAQALLFGWALPYLLGMALTYLATAPLHTLMDPRDLSALPVAHRHFHITRTVESSWPARLVFANLNFHLEHHLYPRVSRWELGAFASSLRPQLRAYAASHQLPLVLDASYRALFRRAVPRFNPIATRADLAQWNQGIVIEEMAPARIE